MTANLWSERPEVIDRWTKLLQQYKSVIHCVSQNRSGRLPMGYRDDLIQRFRREGIWDQLTDEQRRRFQSLTDQQAREMMVLDDQWEMSDEKAIGLFGAVSLSEMIVSFKGALVERGGPHAGKLTKAGRLLAEFFLELRARGLSSDDVDAGLRKLSPLVIAALETVYKRQTE